jgi:membrane fusion protein, copper/silver efflux system
MLERCSGIINSQELPEQRSGVQKMSSSVVGETVVVSGAYLLQSELVFKKGADPMAGHKM